MIEPTTSHQQAFEFLGLGFGLALQRFPQQWGRQSKDRALVMTLSGNRKRPCLASVEKIVTYSRAFSKILPYLVTNITSLL